MSMALLTRGMIEDLPPPATDVCFEARSDTGDVVVVDQCPTENCQGSVSGCDQDSIIVIGSK